MDKISSSVVGVISNQKVVSGMKQGWAFAWRSLMAAEIYVTIITGFGLGHLLHYGRELHESGSDAWVVQHVRDPESAELLATEGREIFGSDPIFVSEIGPVIGAHTGPGLLGIGGLPASLLG